MHFVIGNTNLHGSSSSGLGYDCFYMKSTDGTTMYFNLVSGIGSSIFQIDYLVKLREKDERKIILPSMVFELTTPGL